MFKNKKGVNDTSILIILCSILFLSALILPRVVIGLNETMDEYDIDTFKDDEEGVLQLIEPSGNFFVNLYKLAFWDFSGSLGLPFWLQGMYSLLSIIILVIVYRLIRSGGG